MSRYIDSSEPVRGPSVDNFVTTQSNLSFSNSSFLQDHDDYRPSTKWSPRRNQVHLNTNNSNNNPPTTTTRLATVKSARRDNGIHPNVRNLIFSFE